MGRGYLFIFCLQTPLAEFPHHPSECPLGVAQLVPPQEWASLMEKLNAVATQQRLTYLAPVVIGRRMLVVQGALLVTFVVATNVWTRTSDDCDVDMHNGTMRTRCGRGGHTAALAVFVAALIGIFASILFAAILMNRAARREANAALALKHCITAEIQPAVAGRGVTVELGEQVVFRRRIGRGSLTGRRRARAVRYYVRFTLPPGMIAQPLMSTAGLILAPQQAAVAGGMMQGGGYGGQPMVPMMMVPLPPGQSATLPASTGGAAGPAAPSAGSDGIPIAMPVGQHQQQQQQQNVQGIGGQSYPVAPPVAGYSYPPPYAMAAGLPPPQQQYYYAPSSAVPQGVMMAQPYVPQGMMIAPPPPGMVAVMPPNPQQLQQQGYTVAARAPAGQGQAPRSFGTASGVGGSSSSSSSGAPPPTGTGGKQAP